MREPFSIPVERLPPGFAERIESPPDPPAPAVPAASAVLLRDGEAGLEVLLMRRHRASGFVPGAYVFPGGRVDDADAELQPAPQLPPEPPAAFWLAATRELFEETGVLLARDGAGEWAADPAALERWRHELLEEVTEFGALLARERLRPDLGGLVHCAHWITPVAEPRRYDTHFFLAGQPPGARAQADPREMTDALWLAPDDALARFAEGVLPMVFPTVKLLESLVGHPRVTAALEAFRGRPVRPILPRLVRTARGVGLVIDEERAP